jgi:hypothetical protein
MDGCRMYVCMPGRLEGRSMAYGASAGLVRATTVRMCTCGVNTGPAVHKIGRAYRVKWDLRT